MQPTGAVPFVDANPRPASPPAITGRLKVTAMNVLNSPASDSARVWQAKLFGRLKIDVIP